MRESQINNVINECVRLTTDACLFILGYNCTPNEQQFDFNKIKMSETNVAEQLDIHFIHFNKIPICKTVVKLINGRNGFLYSL